MTIHFFGIPLSISQSAHPIFRLLRRQMRTAVSARHFRCELSGNVRLFDANGLEQQRDCIGPKSAGIPVPDGWGRWKLARWGWEWEWRRRGGRGRIGAVGDERLRSSGWGVHLPARMAWKAMRAGWVDYCALASAPGVEGHGGELFFWPPLNPCFLLAFSKG